VRTIVAPEPVEIPGATALSPRYAFRDFLAEFVLRDKRWRDEWSDAFAAVVAVGPSGGTLQDADHEKMAEVVRSVEIPPAFTVVLMPFVHAVTKAARS